MTELKGKCFEINQNESANKIVILDPNAKKNGTQISDSSFAIEIQTKPGAVFFQVGKHYKITFDELQPKDL